MCVYRGALPSCVDVPSTFVFGFFFCYLTATHTVTNLSFIFSLLGLSQSRKCFFPFLSVLLYFCWEIGKIVILFPQKSPVRISHSTVSHSLSQDKHNEKKKTFSAIWLLLRVCIVDPTSARKRSHEYHNRCGKTTSEFENFRNAAVLYFQFSTDNKNTQQKNPSSTIIN